MGNALTISRNQLHDNCLKFTWSSLLAADPSPSNNDLLASLLCICHLIKVSCLVFVEFSMKLGTFFRNARRKAPILLLSIIIANRTLCSVVLAKWFNHSANSIKSSSSSHGQDKCKYNEIGDLTVMEFVKRNGGGHNNVYSRCCLLYTNLVKSINLMMMMLVVVTLINCPLNQCSTINCPTTKTTTCNSSGSSSRFYFGF